MTIDRHEVGPLMSQTVVHGGTVYLAGAVADDSSADIRGQTRQILDTIDRRLAAAGSDKSKLLSATIWVREIALRDPMNEVWVEWIDKANPPARACVEAKLARPELLVEIMVVAAT